jgi:hypothetical protein
MVGGCEQLQRELAHVEEELELRDARICDELSLRSAEEERLLLLDALRKWQMAYDELRAISESKLISKDEEINLLTLKLTNLG